MATAGVVNFGAASPSPAGSVVKCYCHQCSKNFILVDQNTEPSCPECHSEFVERLEPIRASTDQSGGGPGAEESDGTTTNGGLRHRRAYAGSHTRHVLPGGFAQFVYPSVRGNPSVVIHQHPGHVFPFSRLSTAERTEQHAHPMMPHPMLIQFPFAPAPIHGNPGDYAWGPTGLDNIITRLLNQLDDRGSPPAKKELVEALPVVKFSGDNISTSPDCSVCKDSFNLDEELLQLPCKHVFHRDCIMPWLQMRDTCPTCRFSINSNESFHE
ncbi:hypothetical protein EMCRGX_G021937 [Ephydatia muelleri]